MISSSIGDIMEAEFSIQRDNSGYPMLPREGITMGEWLELTHKATASLIANSCQCALMLAGHGEDAQRQAYEFGWNIAIAHQVSRD
jgi:decaprenyl-diphosphate synthase subunit 2